MRRRRFSVFSVVPAMLRPLAAHAQQSGRTRRIGLLMPLAEADPEAQTRLAAICEGLNELAWSEGRTSSCTFAGPRTTQSSSCHRHKLYAQRP